MSQTTLHGGKASAKKSRAEELAQDQRAISISEFFTKNRHLLGFDNPRKALLTTVKEAVDNSLDAAEEMKVLPDIKVFIEDVGNERFKVTIEDNGPGIVKEQIPKIFGKLLYGSKFHKLKFSRGQQGIGISAAALYGQLTTGKPIRIISKTGPKAKAHYFELHLNTKSNEPEITKDEVREWEPDHGTKVQLELEGKYHRGRLSVDEFLQLTAIANPHAHIVFKSPKMDQAIEYPRATKELPVEPKEILPHPYGIELGILIKMLKDTHAKTLQQFLQKDFSRVSGNVAKEICEKAGLYEKSRPTRIARQEADNLFKAIQKTKIRSPPTDCLSPIGEEQMLKGLKKEIDAEFYASVTRPPSVYRGNPFQIECCTGDTKLILENGRRIPIKEYVETGLKDKVLGLTKDLKIVPVSVKYSHKFHRENKILCVKTRTGRLLKVTDNNELPILENGLVKWKKARDVMAGDFIAAPRSYSKVNPKSNINLLEILDDNLVQVADKELILAVVSKLREKYGTLKRASIKLDVDYDSFKAMARKGDSNKPKLNFFKKMIRKADMNEKTIKEIKYIRIIDTNVPNTIKLPIIEIDEDLLYLLGLIESDGYLARKETAFVNNDEHLHTLFKNIIETKYGLHVYRNKKNSTFSNKTLYIILKKVKGLISTLPDRLIIAWLKGIFDGEGWVSLGNEGEILRVGIASAKRDMAEKIQYALLRISINSKIQKQRVQDTFGFIEGRKIQQKVPKHNIIINASEDINLFSKLISFRQLARSHKLSRGIISSCKNKKDVVPLGNLLREFRIEQDLFQYELGTTDQTVRQVEKGNQNMSRVLVQKIVSKKDLMEGQIYEKLKKLAYSDIYWDKIVDIQILDSPPDYVYDLTTEVGNFVADNIVMHNCSVAYGGDLPGDSLAQVIRYANRVPLQHQAGACAMTKSVLQTAWKNYGLSQSRGALPSGPIVIMIHMGSVWVPFTSESKEAIASYPEIEKEIKLALQEVGRKLASYVRKKRKTADEGKKKSYIQKYLPHVGIGLKEILNLNEHEEKATLEMLKEILEKSRK